MIQTAQQPELPIKHQLQDLILQALEQLNLPLQLSKSDIVVEYPADSTHGDFATTVALSLFKKLKSSSDSFAYNSPIDFARAVVGQLQSLQTDQYSQSQESPLQQNQVNQKQQSPKGEATQQNQNIFSDISIAGPGFINFTLSDAFLLSKMGLIAVQRAVVVDQSLHGQKVMIEFTDPNPFKELHIGHLYSNTVGESISRLYETSGATVCRACYQGDVGMHVAKSIWGMQRLLNEQFPDQTTAQALELVGSKSTAQRVKFLGTAYSLGATAYEETETEQKVMQRINNLVFITAQEELKKSSDFKPKVDYQQFLSDFSLESSEFLEVSLLYQSGRAWSLEYFNQMYSRIGMQFDEFFFESLVGEYGYEIVQRYLQTGVFQKSNGAIIFPGSTYGLHDRVFVNSLGLPTYEAKELGLAPEKYRRFKYDTSLVITGNEIDEYFKVLLQALELTNPDLRKKTVHKSHGMVRLPEGKMSSRTGKVITTEWLLDEAVERIKTQMEQNRPELTPQEITKISEVIGVGAVKYAFLKQSVGKDIAFSFEESLNLTGNSGPYLQYTYVRCLSILEKADALSNIAEHFDSLFDSKAYLENTLSSDEKNILRNINRYYDVVTTATQESAPHYIATHLYELAQLFNVYYAHTQIVTTDAVSQNGELSDDLVYKLALVTSVSLVIKHGLHLLGIKTVQKM